MKQNHGIAFEMAMEMQLLITGTVTVHVVKGSNYQEASPERHANKAVCICHE